MLKPPTQDISEATITIEPPPCSTIRRAAACASSKVALRLTAMTRSHSSRSSSRMPDRVVVPALQTSASMRSSPSTTAAPAPGSVRSTPVERSAVSTRQPFRRNRSAVAAPMPRLAPVTSATLSLSLTEESALDVQRPVQVA
jgi:hypothetical protein